MKEQDKEEVKNIVRDTFNNLLNNIKLGYITIPNTTVITANDTRTLKKRVNTIEDIYKELGQTQPTLDDYNFLRKKKKQKKALYSQYIQDMIEVFNEGWKPTNSNNKYYCYFNQNGLVWVVGICTLDNSSVRLMGSGFYYKSSELAIYCSNKFIDLYSEILDYDI